MNRWILTYVHWNSYEWMYSIRFLLFFISDVVRGMTNYVRKLWNKFFQLHGVVIKWWRYDFTVISVSKMFCGIWIAKKEQAVEKSVIISYVIYLVTFFVYTFWQKAYITLEH